MPRLNKLKIALMGTRGIPASYSGFETCVEQLGQRLQARGHAVSVYCRSHHIRYPGRYYKGMRLIKLPTIANKYLDTITHTLLSSYHALWQRYDVALYFIVGNSPASWIPRLVGTKTLINVDGLDWKREKWPGWAKAYIRFTEYLAVRLPNAYLTDSKIVQAYYQDRYRSTPHYIPYGSEVELTPAGDTLDAFGLVPGNYVLFVGRLVPENCAHHLVGAFRALDTDLKCVIVGDAPYAESYIDGLKKSARNDPRIIFTGYQFGKAYHELGTNALIFVETSGVGGTHPALVEAMAFGNCVIVNNSPENLETIGSAGLAYDGTSGAEALAGVLSALFEQPEEISRYQRAARQRSRDTFRWDTITDQYEQLFYQLLGDH